jgi:hypothetical protein
MAGAAGLEPDTHPVFMGLKRPCPHKETHKLLAKLVTI